MPDFTRHLDGQRSLVVAWLLALSVLVALLFTVLLQHGSTLPVERAREQGAGLEALQPLSRKVFEAQFGPVAEGGAWVERLGAIHASLGLGLTGREHAVAVVETVRTLRTAQVYETRSTLEYQPSGADGGEIVLRIGGSEQPADVIRARRDGDALTGLSISVQGEPVEFAPGRRGLTVPIDLGDLNLQDHLALVSAVANRAFRVVGEINSMDSVPQVALRGDLGSGEAGRAVVAFTLLDSKSGSVRSVWFFDAEGSLLRTYSDFFSATDKSVPFDTFRVDSARFGSFTRVHFDSIVTG